MQCGSKAAKATQTIPKWTCKQHKFSSKELEEQEKNKPPYVFTWWQQDIFQCPKCKRKVVALHRPDQQVFCKVCWEKLLRKVPIMVPVKGKDGLPLHILPFITLQTNLPRPLNSTSR